MTIRRKKQKLFSIRSARITLETRDDNDKQPPHTITTADDDDDDFDDTTPYYNREQRAAYLVSKFSFTSPRLHNVCFFFPLPLVCLYALCSDRRWWDLKKKVHTLAWPVLFCQFLCLFCGWDVGLCVLWWFDRILLKWNWMSLKLGV